MDEILKLIGFSIEQLAHLYAAHEAKKNDPDAELTPEQQQAITAARKAAHADLGGAIDDALGDGLGG